MFQLGILNLHLTLFKCEDRYYVYINASKVKVLKYHFFLTLLNDQFDAQFFYFIINLLQSSACFKQCRAHHQEVKLY